MIRGIHNLLYSDEPEALRSFLRDKLGFTAVHDVGGGWLIFDLPEADMGVHPSAAAGSRDGLPAGTHSISFYCDDLELTIAELEARGVQFTRGVVDEGFGLTARFALPGCGEAQLYQPLYEKGANTPG